MAKRKPQQKTPSRPGVQAPDKAVARRSAPPRKPTETTGHWLWGRHAVLAALANPRRPLKRLLLSEEAQRRDGAEIAGLIGRRSEQKGTGLSTETAARGEIEEALGAPGAVHQGYALQTRPLNQPDLERVATGGDGRSLLVCLDQASDPANIGAVLRSAAALGARAVVTTQRHAPAETGAMAKTASGAMECVPYVQIANLAQGLESLKKHGYWCIGLASEAALPLSGAEPPERIALVMGAEGQGLRRLTRERCDLLLSLPTPGPLKELNLSVATAVALYELLARPR